jgi:1,4-alpha-glucan branching enzyme
MIHKQRSHDDEVLVTFELPDVIAGTSVCLVGDFNAWNEKNMPMQRNGKGIWQLTLPLKTGHDFQFRYLVDGERWYNDWTADAYVPNPHGGKNSVVTTRPERVA